MSQRGPYETTPPSVIPKTLGERIKAVRIAWHWTQAELGLALNTDQTAISAWERERVTPSGPTLAALAHLLQNTSEALESGNGFRIPEAPPTPGQPTRARVVTLRDAACVAQVVDIKKDLIQPLQDPQEVMIRLIQATREGRSIWVVMD